MLIKSMEDDRYLAFLDVFPVGQRASRVGDSQRKKLDYIFDIDDEGVG
jgi:hypothetical protein